MAISCEAHSVPWGGAVKTAVQMGLWWGTKTADVLSRISNACITLPPPPPHLLGKDEGAVRAGITAVRGRAPEHGLEPGEAARLNGSGARESRAEQGIEPASLVVKARDCMPVGG